MYKNWKIICFTLFLVTAVFQIKWTYAGPFTDELSKCIVESTSAEDRIALVRWMFTAASLHPAVKPIALVTQKQREEANKQTAELFNRLLTESCKEQTKKALKYEREIAIRKSFQTLGIVAGQELFSNPKVNAGMMGIEKYLDEDKLLELKPTD